MNTDERINELGKDIGILKFLNLLVIGFCFAFLIVLFFTASSLAKIEKNNVINNNYALSFFNGTNTSFDGIYLPNYGFLIDTRGKNLEEIHRIVNHEALHAFIQQNGTLEIHFCGERE